MYGRVFDVKRFALHDGPGVRVTVHLKGCPLSCQWCHNPESISPEPLLMIRPELCVACGGCAGACARGAISVRNETIATERPLCVACGACAAGCPANAREICGVDMSAEDVAKLVLADETFFRAEDPSRRGGVTLSGGEPLSQSEFCFALLEILGRKGVHRVIDTSGHVPESVMCGAAKHCELFLYDLKHMDSAKHREYTGAGNELILSNLKKLSLLGSRIRLRVPFIPGINSGDDNIRAAAEFASSLDGVCGVNILPYHRAAAGKHRRWGFNFALQDLMEPTEAELLRAREIFAERGLEASIGG